MDREGRKTSDLLSVFVCLYFGEIAYRSSAPPQPPTQTSFTSHSAFERPKIESECIQLHRNVTLGHTQTETKLPSDFRCVSRRNHRCILYVLAATGGCVLQIRSLSASGIATPFGSWFGWFVGWWRPPPKYIYAFVRRIAATTIVLVPEPN